MILRRSLLVLRLLLAAVFIYAAYTKLRQPWLLLAMSIDAYKILPDWGVEALARVLPWFELLLGLMLAAGVWLKYVAPLATGLLLLFFGVMVRSYMKNMEIDCGCFGFGEPLSGATLARDGALLLLSGIVTYAAVRGLPRRRSSAY